ncbi:MAG: ferritin-like domain-containing protein, partial [Sulfuricurvum sp.]
LEAKTPKEKFGMFEALYANYKNGAVSMAWSDAPKQFASPSYEGTCQVVPPQNVPKRSNLTTKEGQINLLHAIAHIEYSAVDLALDAAYRFRDMPKEFYDDWLEVAEDEVRHFGMLHALLEELGACYGEVAVHNALFEASQKTQTLLERMAVVPRYLEANGLDATPMILEKLERLPQNAMLERVKAALGVILEEEVGHVKKGDFWFDWACQKEQRSKEIYFEIIEKYYPQGFAKPRNLNADARKEAGFSCKELNFMAKKQVCL